MDVFIVSMAALRHLHRVSRSLYRRALYSFILIAITLTIGTVGMHYIEGLDYVDAFYFMSMITTAQGPPTAPITVGGKLFASLMAFISIGAVVASLGFLFGPFFGVIWRAGAEHFEEEIHRLEKRREKEGGDKKSSS